MIRLTHIKIGRRHWCVVALGTGAIALAATNYMSPAIGKPVVADTESEAVASPPSGRAIPVGRPQASKQDTKPAATPPVATEPSPTIEQPPATPAPTAATQAAGESALGDPAIDDGLKTIERIWLNSKGIKPGSEEHKLFRESLLKLQAEEVAKPPQENPRLANGKPRYVPEVPADHAPIYFPGPGPNYCEEVTVRPFANDTPDYVDALRDAAAELDAIANRLERVEAYARADEIRQQAQTIRKDARLTTPRVGVRTY